MMRVLLVSLCLVFGCTLSGLQKHKVQELTGPAIPAALSEAELAQFIQAVVQDDELLAADCERVIKKISAGTVITYILPKHPVLLRAIRQIITHNSDKPCKVSAEAAANELHRAVSNTTPENDTEIYTKEEKRAEKKVADYDAINNGIFEIEL